MVRLTFAKGLEISGRGGRTEAFESPLLEFVEGKEGRERLLSPALRRAILVVSLLSILLVNKGVIGPSSWGDLILAVEDMQRRKLCSKRGRRKCPRVSPDWFESMETGLAVFKSNGVKQGEKCTH